MTRKYVVETSTDRPDGYTEYLRRRVELASPEGAETSLTVGDEVLVIDATYSVPALCEVLEVFPELVRLKRCSDQNLHLHTTLLTLPRNKKQQDEIYRESN
jgi:hypothetical protein